MNKSASPEVRSNSSHYEYNRKVLETGATFVTVRQPHLHSGSIAIYFRTGSRYESAELNGISHFLEHMVFRGNDAFATAHDLNLAAESLGGTLYAATAPDSTEFELTLPPECLAEGAKLLGHTVSTPLFSEIEIERRVVGEEIREELNEHDESIDIDFLSRKRLWPDHPLGQSVLGSYENAMGFTTNDLERHLHTHYIAENAIICLSGSFDKQVVKMVEDAFSQMRRGTAFVDSPPLILGKGPSYLHQRRPGSQTHIRLAFHAPGDDDPDRYALSILMGILDDGMSTRLHRRIFDELGLAYHVSASIDNYSDVSALNIDATTSHENVPRITHELLDLICALRDGTISDTEIKKAIRRSVWGIRTFYDDPHAMSSWYGEQALFRIPTKLEDESHALEAVSHADVARLARRIFVPENLFTTTIGRLKTASRKQVENLTSDFSTKPPA